MNYQLIQGDCLEVMPTLSRVDAIVTDPPYGINENSRKNLSRGALAKPRDYGIYNWDSERIGKEYILQMLSISKQQVIFGGNYYTDMLPPSPSWIVWDKDTAGDFADFEIAWTSHKKTARIFRWRWSGFLKQEPEERFHPTQKPIALMRWIVKNYTDPGDIVCDPFMGSGTTGVACAETGRAFVGIDRDEHYFAIAQERIEKAYRRAAGLARQGKTSDFANLPMFTEALA